MSKFLSTLLAAMFAAVTVAPVAMAAEKASAAIAKACKGKEAGTEVTMDGKKVKCPAAKK